MWNIPLLKLQPESKPRTFRTHRGHWRMLEYSMDNCHLKKRKRRNLNSRICNLPLKHRSHPPYSCLACVKPFEVLFKSIYWAPSTHLHAGASRWTLTLLTTWNRECGEVMWLIQSHTESFWAPVAPLIFHLPFLHVSLPCFVLLSLAVKINILLLYLAYFLHASLYCNLHTGRDVICFVHHYILRA